MAQNGSEGQWASLKCWDSSSLLTHSLRMKFKSKVADIIIIIFGARDWAQVLKFPRQVLYHRAEATAPPRFRIKESKPPYCSQLSLRKHRLSHSLRLLKDNMVTSEQKSECSKGVWHVDVWSKNIHAKRTAKTVSLRQRHTCLSWRKGLEVHVAGTQSSQRQRVSQQVSTYEWMVLLWITITTLKY